MKKKIMSLALLTILFFTFVSCDLLSTILAAKGFYDEYQQYSVVYEDATQFTVDTTTQLTISDTTVAEAPSNIDTRVYVMIDKESDFLYVEQSLDGVSKTSVYEDAENIYVEYIIGEGDVVLPTLPAAEDQFDSNVNANILNDNFSYESVSNENKIGDHTYSFDVNLNQAINLSELDEFVDELAIFGGDATSFDDAVAHVEISFTSQDSVIDIKVTLNDYTITFEDETYITLSLVNNTILSVPETFEMPNVFAEPYQYVAVDDILLARRAYLPEEVINYPIMASENGYALLTLTAGEYELETVNSANFTYVIYDSEGNVIDTSMATFTVANDGNYYIYIQPTANFQSDIMISAIGTEDVSEDQITTEPTPAA